MDLLNLCLTSTYFQYNGKHYKQLHGTAMGSPVSVVVAEIVMQNIEESALSTCRQTIPLWLRYVDDTFTAVRHDEIDAFHHHLNEQNTDIQFTREVEENGKLPFLDFSVSRDDNSLRTSVYRKPTDYWTSHPTTRHHTKPLLSGLLNDNATPTTTATIPYIKGISETISRILQPFNIRVAHKPITTLRQLLTNIKDRDEPRNRQGAVYKINCSDCHASYIGETGRNLTTRLTEHKCLTYSTNYFQRLTLESWFTNLEQTPLNRCQPLPAPYTRLIHDINITKEPNRTTYLH